MLYIDSDQGMRLKHDVSEWMSGAMPKGE